MNKLNLKLLKRSFAIAKPYWFSDDKRKSRWLIFLLVVLLFADTQFNVLFNEQSGEFTSALAAQDAPRFWHSIRNFFALLVVGVPINAYYYFVRDTMALGWRSWLTHYFLDRYFNKHGFYHLLTKPDIDNPDQRISEDIASFTQSSLEFILIFAGGVLQLIAFSHVLWSISRYLVLFLFLYAVLGTMITFGVFGERMVTLYFHQRRREADFRFGLVRVRENAEAIALYHGEEQEKTQVKQIFARLYANYSKIISWTLRLNFVQYGNTLLTTVLPSVIIAPRVLSGELEVGKIVQATGAFAAILAALTLLVDRLDNLSRYAAGIGRLDTLARALSPKATRKNSNDDTILTRESENIRFEDVTVKTPDNKRTLVKGLSFSAPPGESLMIVGPSGLGKSSVLRVIAGLWNSGTGTLERPNPDSMLFLPQRPYLVAGSLRVQLSYPKLDRKVSDEELREALEMVNLPHLPERCGGFDSEFDFDKVLSVGERQRVAFARVLLQRPRYALLDESTSALDRHNESALYRRLIDTSTTIVSVSHHPSLVRYHSQVLELKADGAWQLHPAEGFRFTEDLA